MHHPRRSLVLLSGGLDSCVSASIAFAQGAGPVLALSLFYGQRHERELLSAQDIAKHYGLDWHLIKVEGISDLLSPGTALVGTNEELPQGRSESEMAGHIPRSYVPGRNTMMLAIASSVAEANNLDVIYTGFNAVDYSGYPDCRPEFVDSWNRLAQVATKRGINGYPVHVHAPIIHATKADIVRLGLANNAPMHLTWSCYYGGYKPCGTCDSCIIRARAFNDAGIEDPANA
jgi:7-cyano-7-deazaguanine synthase